MNPISHGWLADNSNETLVPVPLPSDALAAPKEILTLMCCNCASDEPCVKKKCSRSKSEISCTIFCKCNDVSSPKWCNPLNNTVDQFDDSDSEWNSDSVSDIDWILLNHVDGFKV